MIGSFRRVARRGCLALALTGLMAATAFAKSSPGPLLGKRAPILSGRAAFSPGLINLQQLQHEIVYERDAQGRLVKKHGRFQLHVVRNAVVLNFFATYCHPCIKEIPLFNRIAKSYAGRPVKFVYVNVDTEKPADQVRDFAKAKGIAVEMILPSVRYVMRAYKVKALPRVVVVAPNGVVALDITGLHENLTSLLGGVLTKVLPPAGSGNAAKSG